MMNLSKILEDPRIVYPILFIVIAYPLIRPIGIPLLISPDVNNITNYFNTFPKGSVVVMANDISFINYPEFGPGIKAIFKYFMERDFKVIMLSFNLDPQGALLTDTVIKEIPPEGKTYGVDYVNLGWLTGEEGTIAAFAQDIHKVASADSYGTPIDNLPMMANVKTISDISLWMSFAARTGDFPERYLRQLVANYGTNLTVYTSAINVATVKPYAVTGQVKGFIGGIRGIAEFEVLTRVIGEASANMDSISLGSIWVIILIIIANLSFIVKRLQGKKMEVTKI